MEPWVMWLIGSAALFIVEIILPTVFFFACLGLAALLASPASAYLGVGWAWAVFFSLSVVFVVLSRPMVNRVVRKPAGTFNVDSLIGQKAQALTGFGPGAFGRVKVGGEEWLGLCEEAVSPGEWLEILKVDGAHLVCRRTEPPAGR